jgi:HEAT repeat protein
MSDHCETPREKSTLTALLFTPIAISPTVQRVCVCLGILGVVSAIAYFAFFGREPEPDTLISDLRSNDPARISRAVCRTHDLKRNAKAAVPLLIEILADERIPEYWVVLALSYIGPVAAEALLEALNHENPRVRAGAIRALGRPDPKWERHFTLADDEIIHPRMIKALQDKDERVRAAAAGNLYVCSYNTEKRHESVASLIGSLNDADRSVRMGAILSLRVIAQYEDRVDNLVLTVEPLIKIAHEGDQEEKLDVIWTIEKMGPLGRKAIPVLVEWMRTENEPIRRGVFFALLAMREHRAEVLPLLEKASVGAKTENRAEIFYTMYWSGPLPKSSLPLLILALNDESKEVRLYSVWIIGKMGAEANQKEVLATLVMLAATDPDSEVRLAAKVTMEKLN